MNQDSSAAMLLRPPGASEPALILDRDQLAVRLNKQPCFVHHRLADHPLLALPRLLELAEQLPKKNVRINSGNVAVGATPAQIPGVGLSVADSFRTIENSDTRIMLKGIEDVPEYRDLLFSCIAEIEALGNVEMTGIYSKVGYVFISAPKMVTPYHMDPEINFLLQIRGKKTFHVVSGDDRSILSDQDIERFYAGGFESLPFDDSFKAKAVPFAMAPGDGVHIPVNHPHWVTTDGDVTVSLALTVETTGTMRRGTVFAFNHLLRRTGLKPTPFGQSAWRDGLKNQAYRVWRTMKAAAPGRRNKETEHD